MLETDQTNAMIVGNRLCGISRGFASIKGESYNGGEEKGRKENKSAKPVSDR